jgi:hypothetical protein
MPCKAAAPIGLTVVKDFCLGETDEAESGIILNPDEDLNKKSRLLMPLMPQVITIETKADTGLRT